MFFSNRIINIGGHTLLKMIIGVQFLRCGVVFAFGGYAARVNGPIVEFDRFKLKLFQLGDVVRSVGIIAQAKTPVLKFWLPGASNLTGRAWWRA